LANGSTLDVYGLSQTITALSGSGNISNNVGQNPYRQRQPHNGLRLPEYSCYSGTLTNGSLFKDGTGAMALRGSNAFDGTLTLNGGKLSVGAAPDRIPVTTALNVPSGAVFQLDANKQTLASLIGSGSVNLGGGTLTVKREQRQHLLWCHSGLGIACSSTALGHGLRGYYYDNIDMTSLKAVTDNAQLNFTWGPPNGYALACNGTSTGYGALVTPQARYRYLHGGMLGLPSNTTAICP